jgi:hypothetical protein
MAAMLKYIPSALVATAAALAVAVPGASAADSSSTPSASSSSGSTQMTSFARPYGYHHRRCYYRYGRRYCRYYTYG